MTTSYSIAPSAKWYFADAQGRPAAGGSMETFSSLDHATQKMIYSDPFGLHPYENPMTLDGSGGTKVQMFWQFNGTDLYYGVVKDAAGNIICTFDNFPAIGGGGVTPITANIDIENHLINGQFLFIDAATDALSSISTIPQAATHIAPGSGFFKNTSGEYVPYIDPLYPAGWSFNKEGGVGASDNIAFIPVADIGAGPPNSPSANATRYFQFTLSVPGTAFTDASLTNIIPNVELFSNETITISFDCKGSAGATGTLLIYQHFGAGGTTMPVPTSATFTFNNGNWTGRKTLVVTLPSVAGKTKGPAGDDCLIIKWQFPLNVLGTFALDNHQIERGTFATPTYIEQTYAQDQYKVLMDLMTYGNLLFRTGDYRWSDNVADIPGWLRLENDAEYIGKTVLSTANHYGQQYQNLYILWWGIYPQTGSVNQMTCDVNGGRGGSALADFNADKRMKIPFTLVNRVFGVAGNAFGPDYIEGSRTAQLPAHTHTSQESGVVATFVEGVGITFDVPTPGITGSTGDVSASNMQPTSYKYLFVKL